MNVGLIGCGFIGSTIAGAVDTLDDVQNLLCTDQDGPAAVSLAQVHDKARSFSIENMDGFIEGSDLVIECASAHAVREYGVRVLEKGTDLMIMSVSALTDVKLWSSMKVIAKETHAKIIIPSGGVAGTDGLASAVEAQIDQVTLVTTKNPRSFLGVDYVANMDTDIQSITKPLVIFEGSAREAATLFPRNLNVSTTISIVGIGSERTTVKLIADPATTVNRHELEFSGRFGKSSCVVENTPSMTNPKTSYLAALSAIATLKKVVSGIWIG